MTNAKFSAMRLNPRNIVKLIEDHFRFHPETEITTEERGLAERLIFQIQRHFRLLVFKKKKN